MKFIDRRPAVEEAKAYITELEREISDLRAQRDRQFVTLNADRDRRNVAEAERDAALARLNSVQIAYNQLESFSAAQDVILELLRPFREKVAATAAAEHSEALRQMGVELAEARMDTERLNFIITKSNLGEPWLDEEVWDNLPGDSDNMHAEIRALIDERREVKP